MNNNRFPLKHVYSAVLLALSGAGVSPVFAASTGGCDNYTPTSGQTVTCTSSVTPAATNGVQTAQSNTGNNNVTVNVGSGTVLSFQGSPIGIGSTSTVTNSGTLNSGTFYYGYGISFGANGRSGAGGNSVTNTASGVIQTGGTNASGIYVNAPNTTASPNTIVNAGSIATSGGGASYGINLINRANTDSITNTGNISSATTDGISVTGAANITNSGSISGAVNAVNFNNTTANTNANTLTLQAGSVISGAIAFSTNKTSETLAFDGLSNSNFNNTVTGANIIKAINGATVNMSSGAGYALGAGEINVDGTSALNVTGVLQNGAIATSINKTGVGTLTLAGANTYTGDTVVSAGALKAGSANAFSSSSAVTMTTGSTLNLNNFNQTIASLAGSGSTNLGTATLTTGASNASTTYNGSFSGLGNVVKNGSGTWTLGGTNSSLGDMTVNAGTLNLTTNTAVNSDTILTLRSGTTVNFAGSGTTYVGVLFNNGGTVSGGAYTATMTATNSGALNSVIADGASYAAGIYKYSDGSASGGTTTVGAANTFTGLVKIAGGTLQLASGGSFSPSSSLFTSGTGASQGVMNLNGFSQTFSAINGTGGQINLGSGSLGVSGTQASDYYGQIIGSGGLTKDGTGTLSLYSANTYSGGTVLNAGQLAIANNAALGTGSVSLNDGSTLAAAESGLVLSNNVGLTGATTVDTRSNVLTMSGVVSGSGSLTKAGAGELVLSSVNTYSGSTTISAGTLTTGTANALSAATDVIVNNGAIFNLAGNNQTIGSLAGGGTTYLGAATLTTGASNASTTYDGVISGTGALVKSGSGTMTLTGGNTYTGGTTVSAGTLAGNTTSLQGNIVNNAAVIFNQNTAGTYSSVMSGTGSLTKTGSDTLTLTGANTYTGGTTVSAGTLAGNTTSLQGNIVNNAAVIFNQNTTGTYAGVMSGSGTMIKTGSDALTLSGLNTYTGDTMIQSGTLNLTGALGSAMTTVAAGATLQGGGTLNGSLTNAGNVQPATGSTRTNLTVTGNYVGSNGTFTTHTYGPSTTVTADTLSIGGQTTGSTTILVRDSGNLGQPTTGNGILIVNSPNSTSTTAFQTGRIAAGAYEYKLVQTNGSWYLKTSDNAVPSAPPTEPDPPGEPVTPQAGQRIETALYPALPTLARMYALNVVDSYDQRRGDLALLSDGGANRKSGAAWGRLMGKIGQSDPSSATFGPMLKSRTYGVQVGLDLVNQETSGGGQTFIGPFATFGQATGRVSSQSGAVQTGSVSLNAYSGGINATHITKEGHYIDALVQGTYFENATANSLVSTAISTQGSGLTASVEGGYKMAVTTRMSFIPQLQVIYNLNSLKSSTDAYSQVAMPNDSATLGRVGFKLSHNGEAAGPQASNVWARVSGLSMLSGANTQTSFSNLAGTNTTTLNTQAPTSWMAFDIGANKVISGNHLVYLNAGYESALSTMYQAGYVKGGYTYRF